jgi:DNA (cytosine-5)-methyltransferase 1
MLARIAARNSKRIHDEVILSLTCAPAQKQTERCHPDETRPFTVREYARIQTFPDSWQFAGSLSSQYRQIGNAVPVNLAKEIGLSIIESLNKFYLKNPNWNEAQAQEELEFA